jgi:hypothetical protein
MPDGGGSGGGAGGVLARGMTGGGLGWALITGGRRAFRVEGGRRSAGGGFSFSVPADVGGKGRTFGSF